MPYNSQTLAHPTDSQTRAHRVDKAGSCCSGEPQRLGSPTWHLSLFPLEVSLKEMAPCHPHYHLCSPQKNMDLLALQPRRGRGEGAQWGPPGAAVLTSGAPLSVIHGPSSGCCFSVWVQDQLLYFQSVTDEYTVLPCRTGSQLIPTTHVQQGPNLSTPTPTGKSCVRVL